MRRIVVLGTGTSVGKTHVIVELIRAIRRAEPGKSIVALKPIETGMGEAASDAERLAAAVGSPPIPPLHAFETPISPHLAARRAGVSIDVARVAAWIGEQEIALYGTTSHVTTEQSADGVSFIETAGGLFSPLSANATNYDLARALRPALGLLVAPDALGVLHDVTAALRALEQRGGRVDHVVLSAARPADASTGTNAAELRGLGIADVSAVFGVGAAEGLDGLVPSLLS